MKVVFSDAPAEFLEMAATIGNTGQGDVQGHSQKWLTCMRMVVVEPHNKRVCTMCLSVQHTWRIISLMLAKCLYMHRPKCLYMHQPKLLCTHMHIGLLSSRESSNCHKRCTAQMPRSCRVPPMSRACYSSSEPIRGMGSAHVPGDHRPTKQQVMQRTNQE